MLNATATETSDQGSPSSVHTLGTTPQVQATTADSQGTLQKAARAAWLADVRVHAHPKLTKLSMVHARKGQKAYARQRQLILEGREAERRGKVAKATKLAEAAMRPESYRAWHMNRAKGLFQRFERVTGCGQDFVQATCRGCTGQRDRTPMRCGVVSLCPHCRGRRARLLRARFEVGRRRALQNAGRAGFTSRFRSARYGGAMAERFATFTIPHAPGESAAVSMTRLRKAWSIFAPKLLRYLREYCSKPNDREDVGRIAARVRVIEATTGTLGEGHPHIHVWLLTPFIPRVWLVHAWGEALSRAGAPAPVRSRSSAIMEALRPFVNGREITNPLAFKSELTRLRKLFRTRKGKDRRELAIRGTIEYGRVGGRVRWRTRVASVSGLDPKVEGGVCMSRVRSGRRMERAEGGAPVRESECTTLDGDLKGGPPCGAFHDFDPVWWRGLDAWLDDGLSGNSWLNVLH